MHYNILTLTLKLVTIERKMGGFSILSFPFKLIINSLMLVELRIDLYLPLVYHGAVYSKLYVLHRSIRLNSIDSMHFPLT
jgi:hypothetical protein